MIWLAIVGGIVAIIAWFVFYFAGAAHDTKYNSFFTGIISTVLCLALGTISLFEKVEFGTVKVGTLFGAVKDTTLAEGINFPVNPFMEWTVYNVQSTTEDFTGDRAFECLSKDDKEYWMEASVSWILIDRNVYWTKQNIQSLDNLVRAAIRTGPRKAAAEYDLMDTNDNLPKLEERALFFCNEAVEVNMRNTYGGGEEVIIPFRVTKVDFRKPQLPQEIQAAITEKFAKQQESEAMNFVLDKERKEAQRKEIEAQGIADFQRIVSEGINENLLYWRYIEVMRELAGSNNTTFIFAPDGRDNPFLMPLPQPNNK